MEPYYNAPDFLKHVYTIPDPNACYDFADVVIVRDSRDNKLYAAYDSGCSCPSPFEDHEFPTDFTELHSASELDDFIAGLSTRYLETDVTAAKEAITEALNNG